MPVDPATFAAALRQYAAGVCLLTVRDDMDDVGTTVSSVMSVSAHPPLVAVGLSADGYPAEVLGEVGACGLTVLAAEHAIVASRFSSAGRPGARHLLESVPWRRAGDSGAIVLERGLAALDCRLHRAVEAGDHVLALLEVTDVPVLAGGGAPLLRLRGRYADAGGGPAGRG
ncbi:NADH-FMN oxidoreductase RutF, flavin reductase (DIM6/NTAB) family [Geodermatophilus pulveris]|uniref:NADH-FMN oxidoreductase RutF, flavin reductase (DIM6/NTAB) family n=1 Tax=Geodermatophilus pulveris TaxID=1564159 RepID=A0A239DX97_9ACTN|nr:flavin reductase family protein [Geodermatophilus pulveris]SNS36781.1 NADH-FMN oxidoreductase RutF, flavin reductase (DIM6/NTAB) family [Geodermatophilus pulveris]